MSMLWFLNENECVRAYEHNSVRTLHLDVRMSIRPSVVRTDV